MSNADVWLILNILLGVLHKISSENEALRFVAERACYIVAFNGFCALQSGAKRNQNDLAAILIGAAQLATNAFGRAHALIFFVILQKSFEMVDGASPSLPIDEKPDRASAR